MSWKLHEEEAGALRFSPLCDASALEHSASCALAVEVGHICLLLISFSQRVSLSFSLRHMFRHKLLHLHQLFQAFEAERFRAVNERAEVLFWVRSSSCWKVIF